MQSTLKITLAATVLSMTHAISIVDDSVDEQTQCQAGAQQTYDDYLNTCDGLPGLNPNEEAVCYEECQA